MRNNALMPKCIYRFLSDERFRFYGLKCESNMQGCQFMTYTSVARAIINFKTCYITFWMQTWTVIPKLFLFLLWGERIKSYNVIYIWTWQPYVHRVANSKSTLASKFFVIHHTKTVETYSESACHSAWYSIPIVIPGGTRKKYPPLKIQFLSFYRSHNSQICTPSYLYNCHDACWFL